MSRVIGRGWATVDLDRAAVELQDLLEPGGTFDEAPGSAWLGARCRIGRAASIEGPFLVLLEPHTEGRLAAYLARHGEGWAVGYAIDVRESGRWRPGPLGLEEPAPARASTDTFLMLVTRRTIEP